MSARHLLQSVEHQVPHPNFKEVSFFGLFIIALVVGGPQGYRYLLEKMGLTPAKAPDRALVDDENSFTLQLRGSRYHTASGLEVSVIENVSGRLIVQVDLPAGGFRFLSQEAFAEGPAVNRSIFEGSDGEFWVVEVKKQSDDQYRVNIGPLPHDFLP